MVENVDSGGGSPAPVEVRRKESKELLGKDRIALQAALLLDGVKPGQGVTLDLQSVKKRILEENKSPETTKITNGSKHERDEFWKKEEYKHLDTFEKRRDSWIEKTNNFLAKYKDKPEEQILQKLGMSSGADKIYKVYFEDEKGEIGYFAKKVADELTPEQIKDNTALIETIGKFYGKDSSEVARYLAEGIKNVKDNFVDFESVAAQQFNEQMEGVEIINGVHTRSEAWEKKEEAKRVEKERIKAEAATRAEDERIIKIDEDAERVKQAAAASSTGADQVSSAVQAPQEVEKEKSRVELLQEVDALSGKIKGTDHEFTKKFLPVLDSIKDHQTNISENDFSVLANQALGVFEKVDKMEETNKGEEADKEATKKEQIKTLLDLFDSFYRGNRMDSNPDNNEYYEYRIDQFKSILEGVGVRMIDTEGRNFKVGSPEVDYRGGEITVDTVSFSVQEVLKPGFTMDGTVLRPAYVRVGPSKPQAEAIEKEGGKEEKGEGDNSS